MIRHSKRSGHGEDKESPGNFIHGAAAGLSTTQRMAIEWVETWEEQRAVDKQTWVYARLQQTKEDVGYLSLPFSALLPWDRLSKRYLSFSWVCWPVSYWEKSISALSARIMGTHSHAWLWCGPWFGDLRACPILQEKALLPTDPSPQALKLFSYTIKTVKCYTFSSTLLLIQQVRVKMKLDFIFSEILP